VKEAGLTSSQTCCHTTSREW